MAKKKWLGYVGPAIVILGIAVSVVAVWYMRAARPVPGAEFDRIPIDDSHAFVIRLDAKDPLRSFLELRERDRVMWQALIPHYIGSPGRPAIAWSPNIVTVRVERDGRAEVFAFAMTTAVKVGALRLAPEHEPITTHAQGPITLTDHVRSYELAGGAGWNQLVAVGLDTGKGVWKVDLGAAPITDGGVDGSTLWLVQGGKRLTFDAATGRATE
ncbi:MAG TPA: hypothetical protein VMZ53_19220 [Kofleriaceae bacterium]|nr:hypothetical protein [Kofleriaceae bacterium]